MTGAVATKTSVAHCSIRNMKTVASTVGRDHKYYVASKRSEDRATGESEYNVSKTSKLTGYH